jgi:predicted  nucleic acid-binding Zn-ribbon protein
MENNEKKSGNKIFTVLSVLFALLSAFLGYQLYTQKNTTQIIIQEKEKLTGDFETTKSELAEVQKAFDGLQTNNKQLQSELDAKKEQLEDLGIQLQKYKGNSAVIAKLRKEIDSLKGSLQKYVATIDSLNVVNKALNEENTAVKTDLATEKGKTEQLSAEKKQLIDIGSKHKIYELFADAIKQKGKDKEISTTKAKRVDKIRACFILGENKIAKAGELNIFLKITAPDGQVLVTSKDESNMFTAAGEKQYYSAKKSITYNNKSVDMCLYFTKKESDKLKDGTYKVDVYIDGEIVGSSNFDLK